MWEEAKKALEEAEVLIRDDIWNYRHDIMLWYIRRMIAEAADAEAEAQEERNEMERECSGSGSWKEKGRQCSASVSCANVVVVSLPVVGENFSSLGTFCYQFR